MAAVHDYFSNGLLLLVTVMQVLLAVDRWVHKQSQNDSDMSAEMRELKNRVIALEHAVEQITTRASEINSTLQRMVGRLEIGRFRGDGQG